MAKDKSTAPFCIPKNSTCCANTYCGPNETCCGGACCPSVSIESSSNSNLRNVVDTFVRVRLAIPSLEHQDAAHISRPALVHPFATTTTPQAALAPSSRFRSAARPTYLTAATSHRVGSAASHLLPSQQ